MYLFTLYRRYFWLILFLYRSTFILDDVQDVMIYIDNFKVNPSTIRSIQAIRWQIFKTPYEIKSIYHFEEFDVIHEYDFNNGIIPTHVKRVEWRDSVTK